jgi:ABC-2 type transport system permease protein
VTLDFLYFAVRSARNRVVRQARRLRTPRYAIAALAGLGYFYLIFGGWGSPSAREADLGERYLDAGRLVGPLLLGLLASWWWLWGGHRRGLTLTPAETHLLVPAPIRRRDVVRFKILQAQVPILFSAILGTFVTRATSLPWPLRLLSLWVLLATLHQHQIAASLVHAAADEQGRAGLRRHGLPLLLFAGALLALAGSVVPALLEIRGALSLDFAMSRITGAMAEPGPRIALAPFRLLLAPLLAPSTGAWLTAFVVAAGVLAAQYFWLQRTDAAFEETAAAQGERAAARVAAVRRGGPGALRVTSLGRPATLARPLLPLRPTGRPAYAVLWKNVLYIQRAFRPLTLLLVVVILALVVSPSLASGVSAGQAFRALGFALLLAAAFLAVVGPLAVRNDLRMDLRHIEALRTYPVRGRDLVLAEIGAAAAVISVAEVPLAVAGLASLAAAGSISPAWAATGLVVAAVLLPPLCALAVTIQNALVLLYPGWVRVGEHGSGGMEAVGQNMITLVGTILLMVVAAIPPFAVAGVVAGPLALVSPLVAVPAGLAALAAALVLEVWLLARWLGGLYDRTDPVAAGLLR